MQAGQHQTSQAGMGRNRNGVRRVSDTLGRHARRPPYPRRQQNTATVPLRARPTKINQLHYCTLGQTRTQLTSNETDVPATQTTIRLDNQRQQRDGTHANQADDEAAKTTAHQPYRSCSRDLTVNRPHASRPTLNQPGSHGLKREWRPTGWPRHGAPRLATTIPTNKTEHRDSTVTHPTNQH